MGKPIAWYDPSNGMVSTDQDSPLFTPLGQVWGLYLKEEANEFNPDWDTQAVLVEEIQRMAKRIEELEAKDEPYALEASMFSNDRVKVDPVTGNVSIGTVMKACGLECDCTDVCKQDDYKALWQQMCERCDELDKKLAQQEHEREAWKWHQAPVKTSWGDGMVVADLAIDKDHTASIYCERDQTAKVEAMFTQPHQEAKDEPVAWMVDVDLANYQGQSEYRTILAWNAKPVWSGTHEINEVLKAVPLYTTPPQRKPLTDEEIQQIFIANSVVVDNGNAYMVAGLRTVNIARAIEAKLKQKNFKE